MTELEAVAARHSVRRYKDEPISEEALRELSAEVARCNEQSGMNIQLIANEPLAFTGMLAHYGGFSGVSSYIALVGDKKDAALDEKAGWYGERLVLLAQRLGLNTCWVAVTYKKSRMQAKVGRGERVACVISLGVGETQGKEHRSKPMEKLCSVPAGTKMPAAFRSGMEAAMLAPTAVNQQHFLFELDADGSVSARSTGGSYSLVDLGIVKYHFAVGAGLDTAAMRFDPFAPFAKLDAAE